MLAVMPQTLQNKPKTAHHDGNDGNDGKFDPAAPARLTNPAAIRFDPKSPQVQNPSSALAVTLAVTPAVTHQTLQNKPKTAPGDGSDGSDGIFDPPCPPGPGDPTCPGSAPAAAIHAARPSAAS
jgi:hypothetical protein